MAPLVEVQSPGPPLRSWVVLRRLLAILVPTALLLGLVVVLLYYQDLSNERTLSAQAGNYIVDLQADIIGREVSAIESDLLYLADQAVLRDFLTDAGRGTDDLAHEYLRFCGRKRIYDQIRYLDNSGKEVVRINDNEGHPFIVPKKDLQPKASRYYFSQTLALGRGQVFMSPFDLNVEHDEIERPLKPALRLATPVFDTGGTKRGVLVLNYLGKGLLRKLAGVSANGPGVTFLLNRDGYFLRGPTPDDEWGFMFANDRTFAKYFPAEWQQVAASEQGQVQTEKGLFTFRTLPPAVGGRADPGRADDTLRVVSYIPAAVVHGRASQLLSRMLVFYVIALALTLVLACYLAYAGAVRNYHERQIAESEARLRALSFQLMNAQEEERRSVSRDLHDEMGQVVTSISLDLQRAGQVRDAEKKDDLLARALRATESLLESIHRMSSRLRPALLDDLSLKDAVQNLLGDYERSTGILPQATLRFEGQELPALVGENVYRILQEALTNVAKHARVSEVMIDLQATADRVVLSVRDEGVGFTPAALDGKRLGILGMRERAELLEGTLVVKSQPNKGTDITATIPVRRTPPA